MLNRSKIDDWIRQVEAMPAIAPIIIRQITARLLELDEMNETLRAENLELSSGSRVKEYERKIAELEFQLELLRRQVGGEAPALAATAANLILFTDQGQVARLEPAGSQLSAGNVLARADLAATVNARHYGMLAAAPVDELLFVFSSGRTFNQRAELLPACPTDGFAWHDGISEEMNSQEELVAVVPVTRMGMVASCIQVSRFGYAKRIASGFFKSFVSANNVGRGAKFNFDRMLGLVLCNDEQLLVAASRAGNLLSLPASDIPVAMEEMMKFKVNDYLIAALVLDEAQSLLALTRDGTAYVLKHDSLQPARPYQKRARAMFSARDDQDDAPMLAGAAAVSPGELGVVLWDDGALALFDPGAVSSRGTHLSRGEARALALASFMPPVE